MDDATRFRNQVMYYVPSEVRDWVHALPPAKKEIYLNYISDLYEDIDWLPAYVDEYGLWYKQGDPFNGGDELYINEDGGYEIYATGSLYPGGDDEAWLKEMLDKWSEELKRC